MAAKKQKIASTSTTLPYSLKTGLVNHFSTNMWCSYVRLCHKKGTRLTDMTETWIFQRVCYSQTHGQRFGVGFTNSRAICFQWWLVYKDIFFRSSFINTQHCKFQTHKQQQNIIAGVSIYSTANEMPKSYLYSILKFHLNLCLFFAWNGRNWNLAGSDRSVSVALKLTMLLLRC